MKIAKYFCVVACSMLVSYGVFAANYCLNCFDQIDEKRKILCCVYVKRLLMS